MRRNSDDVSTAGQEGQTNLGDTADSGIKATDSDGDVSINTGGAGSAIATTDEISGLLTGMQGALGAGSAGSGAGATTSGSGSGSSVTTSGSGSGSIISGIEGLLTGMQTTAGSSGGQASTPDPNRTTGTEGGAGSATDDGDDGSGDSGAGMLRVRAMTAQVTLQAQVM